jgi:hypothetical protein
VGLDKELVSMLERSRQMMGEAYPIIIDYDGEVLSGVHRKKAGWAKEQRIDTRELAKKWNVTPKMAKLIVRAHMDVQRKPCKEETQALIWFMAAELVKKGVPEDKVASELTKYVPYSQKYIWELLPESYKRTEKAQAGKKAAETLKMKRMQTSARMDRAEKSPEPRKEQISGVSAPGPVVSEAQVATPPAALSDQESGEVTCSVCGAVFRLVHAVSGEHRIIKIRS